MQNKYPTCPREGRVLEYRARYGRQTFIWERRPLGVTVRNWDIARRAIKEGQSLRVLADAYGLSAGRVNQICCAAMRRLEGVG